MAGKHKIQCPDCKGHPFKDWTDKSKRYCMTCRGAGVILVEDKPCPRKNSEISLSA